ncbi:hypothetical protein HY994_02805 [Candidatus Micrarchaeota archaeon]|nr:hypothetical protein [Candidatus Micrarchaeota archaeon]
MPSKKPSEKPIRYGPIVPRALKNWAHYLPAAGLVLTVVLFGLTQSVLFALAALALLAYLLYAEFKATKNVKDLAKEITTSIAVALGAWIALSLILNTTSPINIITSCSMLPDFERGDLIILQGAGTIQAPEASVPYALANATYVPAAISSGGKTILQIYQPMVKGQAIFQPQFGICQRQPLDKTKAPAGLICLKAIQVNDTSAERSNETNTTGPSPKTMSILQSPDVVVYDSQTPAGLIIHRAFGILNGTDGAYIMTKGDNNIMLDVQSGFRFIPHQTAGRVLLNLPMLGVLSLNDRNSQLQWLSENQIPVKGKVLLRIPYIGYIKLLLFLQIQAPAGCDSTLGKPV